MIRSLAQEEGVDPYHFDLVLISLFFFFKNNASGSSPTREHAEPNLFHVKPTLFKFNLEFRSGKSYGFLKPCAMARIRSQSYFR